MNKKKQFIREKGCSAVIVYWRGENKARDSFQGFMLLDLELSLVWGNSDSWSSTSMVLVLYITGWLLEIVLKSKNY